MIHIFRAELPLVDGKSILVGIIQISVPNLIRPGSARRDEDNEGLHR